MTDKFLLLPPPPCSSGFVFDNRWVVPYNPYLTMRYKCHINVEVCSSITTVKYLYKYVYKGHDRALAVVRPEAWGLPIVAPQAVASGANGNNVLSARDEVTSFSRHFFLRPPSLFFFPSLLSTSSGHLVCASSGHRQTHKLSDLIYKIPFLKSCFFVSYVQRASVEIFPNCTIVCPISFVQKCELVLYIVQLKGNLF